MKNDEADRSWHVILSEAKNLCTASEILRFTQNDMRGERDSSLHSE